MPIVTVLKSYVLDIDQLFKITVMVITRMKVALCYGKSITIKKGDNMSCSSCCLSSCVQRVPVFKGLTDAEVALIEGIIESKRYSKGDLVCVEGEPSDSLFVLHSGMIKLTQSSRDGKEHILRFLFPGDYCGQFSMLKNTESYVNAEMLEEGTVCCLHREQFLPLLAGNATLAYNFLLSMSEQLHYAEEWAGAMHMLEVEQRLAKILIYFYSKDAAVRAYGEHSREILLPAPKKEIAAMIGTTAETLSRKLNQFVKWKWIAVRKRVINILDLDALIGMSEIRTSRKILCT
ncbi:Crp/Fnr family transcriptional regulator [Paenibacillus sp. GCM10012306]|uniref:Crp/Fnr family transcriptional regulator n=1 Tax=Paenibacillus sp. GCM10012306 TaxID=3317342 RepID=UPI0036108948